MTLLLGGPSARRSAVRWRRLGLGCLDGSCLEGALDRLGGSSTWLSDLDRLLVLGRLGASASAGRRGRRRCRPRSR